MRKLTLILVVICFCLLLFGAAGVTGLVVSLQSKNNIQTLLIDGKTASAIAAKKTAKEVKSLEDIVLGLQKAQNKQNKILSSVVFLVKYVKRVETQGQKATTQAIGFIEHHLDATIKKQIHETGMAIEKEVIRFNLKALIPKLDKLLSHK